MVRITRNSAFPRPQPGHTDAQRNLISNIQARGVSAHDAALRIINLAARMMTAGISSHQLGEELRAPMNTEIIAQVHVPG
jgi:hypothetical protein